MSKNIRQHLADLSQSSVRDIDYGRLASVFGNEVQRVKEAEYQNEIEFENGVSLSEPHIAYMRTEIAKEIEAENSRIRETMPVISVFEAVQISKSAATQNPRDIGILNLVTHLEKKWNRNREANLTSKDVINLKKYYDNSYPKSKSASVIEGFLKSGYLNLPVSDLMEIAANIKTQADYDFIIEKMGLHVNNPYNKKARNFILSLVNGN